MQTTTGAQLLISLLQAQGITTVAGIPGGSILPFYDALWHSDLRHVLARSEQGAAFIAQGMARTTGEPAVCLATSGPGATNLLTGIADAWRDSIPVIAITGQVPRALIGTQAFQEIDIISMAQHCTKAAYRIASAAELRKVIPEAFALARTGRPGPVWIDIPKDVFTETCAAESLGLSALFMPSPGENIPPRATLQAAATALARAERPLLYMGGGMQATGAAPALRSLLERTAIPAIGTLLSLGALPTDHPLWMGMLGMHGEPTANLALDRCDVLLVAGARFDDRATGTLAQFAPQAQVIHIDCDLGELNRLRKAYLALPGDLGKTLDALAELLPERNYAEWYAELAVLKAENPMPEQYAHDVLRAIAETAEPDCYIATDVGQHQMWTAQAWPFARTRQWLTSGGLGTMGFGLPTAIGSALAHPDAQTVCITGDGSILMNLQELATLAETGGNVKICLFDNGALGMVRQQQTLFFGGHYSACMFQSPPDLCAIARGFGIATTDAQTDDNWQRLFRQPGPALIRFAIPADEIVWPMVPGGRANREMLLPQTAPQTVR